MATLASSASSSTTLLASPTTLPALVAAPTAATAGPAPSSKIIDSQQVTATTAPTPSVPAAEVSPFEDPTPLLIVPPPPTTSGNTETNPFRVRNSSSNNSITTPTVSVFPTTTSTMAAVSAPPVSPVPKSKNPFLDLPSEDNIPPIKVSEEDKTSPRKVLSGSTNGAHLRPPRPSKPTDPNAPARPRSPHRRPRDHSRPSDRERERERYRERRDRPSTDPSRRARPRSNSESSVPNERSSRRREDGHVHKSRSKLHDKKDERKGSSSSAKRRLHPVDKIDLLDVTGAYGIFHHDGPFDACRPHRNKQPHKAPVAAFPADSVTNTLAGGLGEVPGLDRNKYFGIRPQEAFEDFGTAAPTTKPRRTSDPERPPIRSIKEVNEDIEKVRPSVGVRSTSFDPRLKTEPVHGVESVGLGTSTFLEGAPAPKAAIEKAMMNDDDDGALTRTKSIVQKITGRRGGGAGGERSPPPPMSKPLLSPNSPNMDPAYNPFFKEGQFVERVESLPTNSGRERADSGGSDKGVAGGLISRVKSLKISGGRRGRKVEESS